MVQKGGLILLVDVGSRVQVGLVVKMGLVMQVGVWMKSKTTV